MHPISHSVLVALVLASGIAAASKPDPHPTISFIDKDRSFEGSSFGFPGGLDFATEVLSKLPEDARRAFKHTSGAGYANAYRHSLANATEYLTSALLGTSNAELVNAFAKMRDEYQFVHAIYGISRIHLPSCFRPDFPPEKRKDYLKNLLFVAGNRLCGISEKCIVVPVKDLVLAAAMHCTGPQNAEGISHACTNFVDLQADQLQGEFELDGDWSSEATSLFVKMLARIKTTRNTDGKALQRAVSAHLYNLVANGIKPHVGDDEKLVTGGISTLKDVLSSLHGYLANEVALDKLGNLYDSVLRLDHRVKYNPLGDLRECGSLQPSIYDIVDGLLRVIQISVNDRKILAKSLPSLLLGSSIRWTAFAGESDADTASRIARGLEFSTRSELVGAAIRSALLGNRPSQGQLGKKKAETWSEWQVPLWALEDLATHGQLNVALLVLDNLGKANLIPAWEQHNLLRVLLKKLANSG